MTGARQLADRERQQRPSVHYLDLRGELPGKAAQLSGLPRLQNAITNRQQTGQAAGVGRRSWKIEPAASHVALGFQSGALLITLNGDALRVDKTTRGRCASLTKSAGAGAHQARPATSYRAVDRVRALPWFGSDRMQAVKAIAFAGLDWLERTQGSVTATPARSASRRRCPASCTRRPDVHRSEKGWPPAPLVPVLSPALEGRANGCCSIANPFLRNTLARRGRSRSRSSVPIASGVTRRRTSRRGIRVRSASTR